MGTRRAVVAAILVPTIFVVGHAQAAEGSKSTGLGVWNVESMVEQAADQIITRYKLNDQQAAYTRQLMSRRVNQLLDKHEDDIRALFREAMAMRMMGKPPSVEAIQSWAKRAAPIYQEAKKHILEGNKEWAEILSPEQKKTHELDVKMMEMDFAQYEKRLERWSEGGFDPKKDWVVESQTRRRPMPRSAKEAELARARAKAQAEARAKAQAAKGGPEEAAKSQTPDIGGPPAPIRIGAKPAETAPSETVEVTPDVELDPEHFWDVYVRGFIKQYHLDKAQTQQALAILKDCKERARRHRDAHREDYLRLHKQIREARARGAKAADANEELADLDGPINELFEELKRRLENIPTSAQIEKYRSTRQTGK